MEAVTLAPVRSRREVTIWSVGAYLGVWLFALGVAGLAGATGDPAKQWDELGRAILGFAAGALLGHLGWAVLVSRWLRPFGRRRRSVMAVGLGPVLGMVVGLPLLSFVGLGLVPLLAFPGWLVWRATEPEQSIVGGHL